MDLKKDKTYYNPVNGEYTRILESSRQTNGEYTFFEVKLTPGGGNPLHYHTRFSEEFFAVQGNLGLQYGKDRLYLKPGESFMVTPRNRHRFFNGSKEDIIFRVRLTKGQPDFENFLKAMFGLVNDRKTFSKNQVPKNIGQLAVMYRWGDTHLAHPLFRLISPMAGWFYKQAVKKGVEKALLEKYCS